MPIVGQKVVFTGLRDLIRSNCLLNGGRCGKMPEYIGFDLISQCNTQSTLTVCCEQKLHISNSLPCESTRSRSLAQRGRLTPSDLRWIGCQFRPVVPAWAVYFSKNWISIANIYTVAAICIVRTPHLRYRHLWRSLASASSMVDSVCFLLFVLNGSITHRARIKRTIVFWSMGWSTKSDSGLLADTIRIDEQSRNNQH